MNYSRKDRRRLAKQFGLINSDDSNEKIAERRVRSMEAGSQIHRKFLSENEVRLREAASERESKQLENLVASYGQEEATRIMENNRRIQEARAAKLSKKKLTQS